MHLGCDWRCMSSYKVACRWRPNRPINSSSSTSSSANGSASTAVKSGAEQSLPTAPQQQQHSQDHTVHIVGAVAPVPEEDEVSFFFEMFNCMNLLLFEVVEVVVNASVEVQTEAAH
jgi:hypothetical protein